MVMYNKDNPSDCPQCGESATAKYHANEPNMQGFTACDNIPGSVRGQPHMHRYCKGCEYGWAEEPVV